MRRRVWRDEASGKKSELFTLFSVFFIKNDKPFKIINTNSLFSITTYNDNYLKLIFKFECYI